ncbi:hypothetical protein C8R43DRAFT_1129439 [Mycena crocata]|nr:hypothetical protein C8R43DRAFT_1129439 [Mycena crocata]
MSRPWRYREPLESWPTDSSIRDTIAGIFPEEMRKNGGLALKECVRQLWEAASDRAHDEGWSEGFRDGMEYWKGVVAAERSEASPSSATPSRSFSSTGSQTSTVVAASPIPPSPRCLSTATQTDTAALDPQLDWVKDTQTIPTQFPSFPFASLTGVSAVLRMIPPPSTHDSSSSCIDHPSPSAPSVPYDASATYVEPPSTPTSNIPRRDFSALRSETSHPFKSLQRRHRRSSRTPRSRRSMHRAHRQTIVLHIYDSHSKNPDPTAHERPPTVPPSFPCPPPTASGGALDWDRDPRLRDLGRALTALGWVPPV